MSGPVYLLSSLPYLRLSAIEQEKESSTDNPLEYVPSMDDFISRCENALSTADFQNLVCAMSNPLESTLAFVLEIEEYFAAIKNAVAYKRHELRRSGTYNNIVINDKVPASADMHSVVEKAVNSKNPFLREIEIIKALWNRLNDYDAQYSFSIENVIVYGYKLKIFHRAAFLRQQRGSEIWKTLVKTLSKKAGFSRDFLENEEATATYS